MHRLFEWGYETINRDRETRTMPEDESPEHRRKAKGNHRDRKSECAKEKNRFSANVVGQSTPEHYGHQRQGLTRSFLKEM